MTRLALLEAVAAKALLISESAQPVMFADGIYAVTPNELLAELQAALALLDPILDTKHGQIAPKGPGNPDTLRAVREGRGILKRMKGEAE